MITTDKLELKCEGAVGYELIPDPMNDLTIRPLPARYSGANSSEFDNLNIVLSPHGVHLATSCSSPTNVDIYNGGIRTSTVSNKLGNVHTTWLNIQPGSACLTAWNDSGQACVTIQPTLYNITFSYSGYGGAVRSKLNMTPGSYNFTIYNTTGGSTTPTACMSLSPSEYKVNVNGSYIKILPGKLLLLDVEFTYDMIAQLAKVARGQA